jgi:uncharacterized protein (TIGR03086 family)
MDDFDLLSDVLHKTGDIVAAVRDDQLELPTPCPEYDVAMLRNHIVAWAQVFEAGANERTYDGDPTTFHSPDPAADFQITATGIIDGWREHGLDREVAVSGGSKQPGLMVLNMTLMEYLTHGWDLATATSQPIPFTQDEAAEVLERAQNTLPPQFQGDGMPFGAVVPVPDDAPAIDRLMGFMGRHP